MEILLKYIKRKISALMTIFLRDRIHESNENRTRIFRITKRVVINLYREIAYQGRCRDYVMGVVCSIANCIYPNSLCTIMRVMA